MYGKFFASTFTGSMFGAGTDVFALWGYIIATATDGTVEVNPPFVAAVLGTTPERISDALTVLCDPDAGSRSGAEDGRRLIHEGAYQYRVVNHGLYRAIRNEEDRRAYNREAKRRERAKSQAESNDMSLTVNECQSCQPIQKQSTESESIRTEPALAEDAASTAWEQWRSIWAASGRTALPLTPKPRDGQHLIAFVSRYPDENWRGRMLAQFFKTSRADIRKSPPSLGWFMTWADEIDMALKEAGYTPKAVA